MPGKPRLPWFTQPALVVPAMILATSLLWFYGKIGFALARDWYTLPDSSHGLLIPFFILFVLWTDRAEFDNVSCRSTLTGLVMVVAGLLLLVVGTFGADLFISRISFVVLCGGLTWTLLGYPMLLKTKFVFLLLLLAIPLPALIFNHITFPLQLLASRLASMLLPLANVPVLREGNVIQLPMLKLEVAEACSGIRSLMSLTTMAVVYGYLLNLSTNRRVLLALSAVPIAVFANAARIFGTGLCVQYGDAEKALGFFHEFSGWLMFLVSLGCLYVVQRTINRDPHLPAVSR